MRPLGITAGGLVTNLGLSRPATLAACRADIDNFTETRFMDSHGEWLIGAEVPLERPLRGRAKLLEIAAMAISEALVNAAIEGSQEKGGMPVLLCLAGRERIGRVVTDEQAFFTELRRRTGVAFSEHSRIYPQGKVAVVSAIREAERLLYARYCDSVLIVAADTLLTARVLKAYDEQYKLLTRTTSNGFVPGEGAACAVLQRVTTGRGSEIAQVLGLGLAKQAGPRDREEPVHADGLVAALRQGLADARMDMSAMGAWFYDDDARYLPVKEATIAELRLLRGENIEWKRRSPISQFGETGTVSTLLMMLTLDVVFKPGAYGLITASGEDETRMAAVVQRSGASGR